MDGEGSEGTHFNIEQQEGEKKKNIAFRNETPIGWNKFYTWSHLKIDWFSAFKLASIIAINWPRGANFKAILIVIDMSESLHTKCKTCFDCPKLVWNNFWRKKP